MMIKRKYDEELETRWKARGLVTRDWKRLMKWPRLFSAVAVGTGSSPQLEQM
jgi:hypothetical protein